MDAHPPLEIYHDPLAVPAARRGSVVTFGNFDGVHLGHAGLVGRARELAGERPVLAVTFEPHPVTILAPHRAPQRLTTPVDKFHLLITAGADAVLVLDTAHGLLGTEAEDFVRRVVWEALRPLHIVEGPTFGFGRGRAGNIETLRAAGAQFGFGVEVVEPLRIDLGPPEGIQAVSSSLVRTLLQRGDVERAACCLGRPYAICGPVVSGAGRGRTLGYPTINVEHGQLQLPGEGVYAGRATLGTRRSAAAISIGSRPTFKGAGDAPGSETGGPRIVLEAFLLDGAGDHYGSEARVELIARLRDQQTFASPEMLAGQIGRDVAETRSIVDRAAS